MNGFDTIAIDLCIFPVAYFIGWLLIHLGEKARDSVDSWSQNKIDVVQAKARELPLALVNPELYDQDPVLLGGEQ